MGILRRLWDKAVGGEVLHDFGQVFNTTDRINRYVIEAKLRRGEGDHRCIRLMLRRTIVEARLDPDPDIYYFNLYFRDFYQVERVFQDAKNRTENQEGPSGEKFDLIRHMLHKISGMNIVHNYSRIDLHPKKKVGRSVECALLRSEKDLRYWFHFGLRRQNYFSWPAEMLIPAIENIAREVPRYTR